MAHHALRPMKWGTSKGTVNLKAGDPLPEVHSTPQRTLQRLYNRGWISDASGQSPAAKPVAKPPTPVENDPDAMPSKTTLTRMSRADLDTFAAKQGVVDPEEYATKGELIDKILGE